MPYTFQQKKILNMSQKNKIERNYLLRIIIESHSIVRLHFANIMFRIHSKIYGREKTSFNNEIETIYLAISPIFFLKYV